MSTVEKVKIKKMKKKFQKKVFSLGWFLKGTSSSFKGKMFVKFEFKMLNELEIVRN